MTHWLEVVAQEAPGKRARVLARVKEYGGAVALRDWYAPHIWRVWVRS